METEQSNFFALIARMKYITRWGLMRNAFPETIEGHSLQVAMIAHALAVIANKRYQGKIQPEKAALYGMFHDTSEILTGDMPTPIKYYNQDIREAYKEIEDGAKERLLKLLPEELQEEYREILFFDNYCKECYAVVKAADKISAYMKCMEELKAGNTEFQEAALTLRNAILAMNRPEINYFMETFLPGFALTLDELGV